MPTGCLPCLLYLRPPLPRPPFLSPCGCGVCLHGSDAARTLSLSALFRQRRQGPMGHGTQLSVLPKETGKNGWGSWPSLSSSMAVASLRLMLRRTEGRQCGVHDTPTCPFPPPSPASVITQRGVFARIKRPRLVISELFSLPVFFPLSSRSPFPPSASVLSVSHP